MKTLNAIDTKAATCLAYSGSTLKTSAISNVSITFEYNINQAAVGVFTYPQQIPQGGSVQLTFVNAPATGLASQEYIPELLIQYGKNSDATPVGDITLKGCQRVNNSLKVDKTTEGAWVLEGSSTYVFADRSYKDFNSGTNNADRGWYFK
jgi:hypothetical protein